jgi:hypothetical protein
MSDLRPVIVSQVGPNAYFSANSLMAELDLRRPGPQSGNRDAVYGRVAAKAMITYGRL